MNYTPLPITAANLRVAVRLNVDLIVAALATKVRAIDPEPMLANLAAGNFRIRNAGTSTDPHAALTLEGAQALIAELS